MPSGHASHKSTSIKPNTNTEGLTNAAADPAEVENIAGVGDHDSTREDEAPENTEATQRLGNDNKASTKD